MFQQSYSVGGEQDLQVRLSGGGDLHLIGADETYLRVQGDGDESDYRPEYQHGTLTLALREDCVLFVPRTLNLALTGSVGRLNAVEIAGSLTVERCNDSVTLKSTTSAVRLGDVAGNLRVMEAGSLSTGSVRGDASIAEVAGDVTLDQVSGDVSLRALHTVHIGVVGGDLRAAEIGGDLSAGNIGGDAKIESVEGNVMLGRVSGDARLLEVGGAAGGMSAGGDLYIEAELGEVQSLAFTAGGDVTLVLPAESNAQIDCLAGGEVINLITDDKPRRAAGATQVTLGEGGAPVSVRAGGDIKLKSREGDAMEFRIEVNKEEMKRVKDEMKRAKEEMKRIKREIREQVRVHRHDARHPTGDDLPGSFAKSMHFEFTPPVPPIPPIPPRTPRGMPFNFNFGFGSRRSGEQTPMPGAATPRQGASEEERLEILRMLEQKRITPEQAEMLLNALGEE